MKRLWILAVLLLCSGCPDAEDRKQFWRNCSDRCRDLGGATVSFDPYGGRCSCHMPIYQAPPAPAVKCQP